MRKGALISVLASAIAVGGAVVEYRSAPSMPLAATASQVQKDRQEPTNPVRLVRDVVVATSTDVSPHAAPVAIATPLAPSDRFVADISRVAKLRSGQRAEIRELDELSARFAQESAGDAAAYSLEQDMQQTLMQLRDSGVVDLIEVSCKALTCELMGRTYTAAASDQIRAAIQSAPWFSGITGESSIVVMDGDVSAFVIYMTRNV